MIVVTGATGKLGQHVIEGLLQRVPADKIAVTARQPARAAALSQRGVKVHQADYDSPQSLRAALSGASKLLLISSSEVGKRLAQHRAVVDAARAAGVGFIAYTSILHADSSPLALASEHKASEQLIAQSGIRHAFLRNGWYIENYTEQLPSVLQHGAFIGSAGEGRIAAATRADFAAAAVAVLTREPSGDAVYELAGDESFSMRELAAEVSRQTGRNIAYHDLPATELQAALEGAGLPAAFAAILVDSDLGAARSALDDRSGQLRKLIGRPTTSLARAVQAAIAL